jgi:class 3 adenylate cyclase/tetratricopeptide (TPR) repeat protein
MDYDELVAKVIELLQREKRVPYRSLKRRFDLDDGYIEDLKVDLIEAKRLAADENDRILVWIGKSGSTEAPPPSPPLSTSEPTASPLLEHKREPLSYTPKHLAEKILTYRSALEGERKQVTVLFCDLANSTPIAERIGPEAMHTLLHRFFELALNEVHRYEGTINQFLGDGLMALFGAPLAHEDHARRAVFAALALQRTLKEADLGEPYGVECAFRMGLNSGLVVVGSIGDNLRMDYSAIGDTTNLAARLQQIAAPGMVLVSDSTSRLVQGAVRLEALPPVQVKGKMELVPLYKVLGTLPRRSPITSRGERILSPFVGRERELATLEALFTQVESGQGQVVGIVAEAGGGKSRLLYEFRHHLQDKQGTYLEGRCLSYGSTMPYHPLIDVLRNNCGISETESPETIIEKVRFALQEVGMDAEESAPYLLQLLGVKEGTESIAVFTPEAIRTRTFETLKQMSLKGSQQRPLIVEIEDLHWIDQTSEAYLSSLVESLTGASMLLLTTYRPDYRPPWVEKSYATQVSLPNLPPQQAITIVHSTGPQQALPQPLEQVIIEKAQGNPFFLEELTRAIIEHGDLQVERMVPDTIQGVLMARIDRLSEEHKRLLQTASVLGREFSPRLLQALWEEPAPLEPLLLDLKRLEFLYERARDEEPVYVFKHALTQDVTYDSLLTTRRQVLHAAAGHALERVYPDWLAEHYEELAHHFSLGEVWEKAFDYLTKSGDKARQAYANQEAVTFYTQALEVSRRIIPALDDAHLLPVYEGRGLVWMVLTKPEAAIADFQRMHALARAAEQPHQEGISLCHLASAYYHTFSDDHLPLIEHYAQEAQHLAQRLGDAHILAQSLTSLGSVAVNRGQVGEAERLFAASLQISRRERYNDALPRTLRFLSSLAYWQGHFPSAIQWAQEGATIARDLQEGFLEQHCLAFQSLACWSQGDYPQAFRITHEVMTKAHEQHNIFLLSRMQNHLGWFSRELGAVSRAAELDHESTDLGRTHGIANVEVSALINLGWDYLALGQPTRARSYLAPTLDRVLREAFGSHNWRWQMRLLLGLAELSSMTGDSDQALRYVEEGLQEAQRTSSQKYVALGWALRGKIAAQWGDRDAAGTELQRAFTLAEQLQSPSLLYPIAYDLGQWYESTGKEREAASLYGKAKATIAQMATAVEDEALRSTFLQSALVQEIHERAVRLGE